MSSLRAYGLSLLQLEKRQDLVDREVLAQRQEQEKEFKQLVRLHTYLQKHPQRGNEEISAMLSIWLRRSQELLRGWMSRDEIANMKQAVEAAVQNLPAENPVLNTLLKSMMQDANTMRKTAESGGTLLAIEIINADNR